MAQYCILSGIVGAALFIAATDVAISPSKQDLDPPLSERTLSALRKACAANDYGLRIHSLLLRQYERSFEPTVMHLEVGGTIVPFRCTPSRYQNDRKAGDIGGFIDV